jgi:hypothetical protein
MKITYFLTALLLVSSLAAPTMAHEPSHHKTAARTHADGLEGREIAAPSWSAACMTDHGPSECGEPMWIYESSDTRTRYRSAF